MKKFKFQRQLWFFFFSFFQLFYFFFLLFHSSVTRLDIIFFRISDFCFGALQLWYGIVIIMGILIVVFSLSSRVVSRTAQFLVSPGREEGKERERWKLVYKNIWWKMFQKKRITSHHVKANPAHTRNNCKLCVHTNMKIEKKSWKIPMKKKKSCVENCLHKRPKLTEKKKNKNCGARSVVRFLFT